ncbi:VOC family protein [Nocardia sp. NBC_00508]|uniref:VOC family protein n=1 Tax=Nocardia sp. NBC_00508 TaxID=2975992 RepID=UPI002E81FFD0|nr:VOC family protein [Nocardia sp. NBC_00508]WUD64546.1 VOC family protein [Nocardia sp. NBC_00508]
MPTHDGSWPQGTPCWVDCQVDDPARARDFYGELFGWEIQDSPPEAGGYLMAMRNGRAAAGIGPKPEGMPMPSVWTTYLAADNADTVAEKVTAAGGALMMAPFDVLDVGRMFVGADPTGAVFGVWESKAHSGAAIYNEHGAYCWNELHTSDYKRAQEFYANVFGWHYTEIGDGQNFIYSTFSRTQDGDGIGGINDSTKMPGDNPSYWLAWFQVDNADTALDKARDLGSTIMSGPDDSPFGRMGIVQGAQGEVFGIIDPTTTVGEPPTGA